jgi:hypothetical protein
MASVYLKSKSGRSLLYKALPTDPTPYLPSDDTMKSALEALEKLGFQIESQGVTLSISGTPDLFEKTCDVEIWLKKKMMRHPASGRTESLMIFESSQPVMHPRNLDDIIDGIIISTPAVPLD